jgi:arsenite oxidase large subunit
MAVYKRYDQLPLPPKNAEVHNTVCQYCTVGCGYKVYVWPAGKDGGLAAGQNAFGRDFTAPQPPIAGQAYTESMHSVITRSGKQMNVAIVPAHDSAINRNGDHSSRGGSNALTLFNESRPTRDRLKYPMLRIGDTFQAIPWQEALNIIAGVIKGVYDRYGNDQLTAKAYDHGGGGGGFENNWAIGSLFFTGLKMQYVAIHNRPAYNSEVWGSRDRGVHELNYTAEDARLTDTLVLWGANPYETASVFYTEHMLPNFQGATEGEKDEAFPGETKVPPRLIVVDPRRTSSLTIAESIDKSRVLHLRPNLGTDYILANAIARAVHQQGWHDQAFIDARTEKDTWADYAEKSLRLSVPYATVMKEAEAITGVKRADMEQAALWMARPKGNARRRSLLIYEKGMIWNLKNYDQIAAVTQLAVLGGNIGKPGTGVGRQGGHQEGYVRPGYPGTRPPPNVDEYLKAGSGKFYWVIGNNPFLTTLDNQAYRKRINARTKVLTDALSLDGVSGEPGTTQGLVNRVLEQVGSGEGLFMVVQDLYMTETARAAHLVLPAAGWGEANLTSINCNSRLLRLYEQFMDPPGDAKPDWQIMSLVAGRLADLYRAEGNTEAVARFSGMTSWKKDEDPFLEGSKAFTNNAVSPADEATLEAENYKGVTYALLKQLGQKGIQTPVRQEGGKVVGTKRRYSQRFATDSGKFKWYGTDAWAGYPEQVDKYLHGDMAQQYPFWMTTGRNQTIWQTAYHDRRIAEKMLTVPLPYIELHPQDGAKLGLAAGDIAEVSNEEGNGTFLVHLTDAVRPGMIFALQYHPRGTSNSMISNYTDPKTTIPWYKGTRVSIRKTSGRLASLTAATSTLEGNEFR